jgi:hypothetical protein
MMPGPNSTASISRSWPSCNRPGVQCRTGRCGGPSPSPCLTRVKRLEQAGYITGYGAHLNLGKLGEFLTVFTEVTLSEHRRAISRALKADRQAGRDRRMPSGVGRL